MWLAIKQLKQHILSPPTCSFSFMMVVMVMVMMMMIVMIGMVLT